MKCTQKETRFEHKSAILVLNEKTTGGGVIDAIKTDTRISIFKRTNGPGDATSAWYGSVGEARELAEALKELEETLMPRTLNAAPGPERNERPTRETGCKHEHQGNAPGIGPYCLDCDAADNLDIGELPCRSGRTKAQGPRPEDGEIIVQMTAQKFSELMDLANRIITDSGLIMDESGDRAVQLARGVSQAFGGRGIFSP